MNYPELKDRKLTDGSVVFSVVCFGKEFHAVDDTAALGIWRRLKEISDMALDVTDKPKISSEV